jgi:hypothetical protein
MSLRGLFVIALTVCRACRVHYYRLIVTMEQCASEIRIGVRKRDFQFRFAEVKAMNILAQRKSGGSKCFGVRTAVLLMALFSIVACDGANQGVQIGTGQAPDPVSIDFPIAFIKAPLPIDEDGEFIQTDLRELITFDFGADLYYKDRASPSSNATNITAAETQGLGAVRDVEIAFDGSGLLFAMRGPIDLNLDIDDEDQPTWNVWEYVF